MQIAKGENLHELSDLVFWKKEENYLQFVVCQESGKGGSIVLTYVRFFRIQFNSVAQEGIWL